MREEDIVPIIFEDGQDVDLILNSTAPQSVYSLILDHGLATKRFLYLDYKGEHDQEIVNYIMDYELSHQITLATMEELEELGSIEYEYLPVKITETNKFLSPKGYGLFSYPTEGDFYALFITKLENKDKLLQVELLVDDWIPERERYIQYYS